MFGQLHEYQNRLFLVRMILTIFYRFGSQSYYIFELAILCYYQFGLKKITNDNNQSLKYYQASVLILRCYSG